ncbi:MAG: Vms1/Ankzf1 family peptidyl-tRNA hydrolase [Nitrospirota bacterium]
MLNREEIIKIARIKGNDAYYVSCYLNVDPVLNTKGDYIIHIKNMLKDAMDRLDKDLRKKIKTDIDRIDSYIFANKRNLKKGLAILSSSPADFWKEFHLSVNLKNEIIVDKTPYIKPLLNILDRYKRYAIVLIDKEFSRLFAVYLGEIEEYKEVFTENVPGRHKRGGWFSLSQKSFERHIDYHVNLHIKDVIRNLEGMLSSGDINRLVIGGSEEAISRAKGLFPKTISDKIIGTISISISANTNEVLSKVQPFLEQYEIEEKNLIVEELLTRTMKKENAVTGLDDVLAALHDGRIMKLLFSGDYRDSGYSCVKCGFITSQEIDRCPYCNSDVAKIDYIIELAAQKAIEQGASVEIIYGNEKFEKAGSIGALLRY